MAEKDNQDFSDAADRETLQQQFDAMKYEFSLLEERVAAMEHAETHTRIGNLEKFVRDEIRRIGL